MCSWKKHLIRPQTRSSLVMNHTVLLHVGFIICNLFFGSQRRYMLCKIRIPTLTFWLRTTFVELQVSCYAPVLHGSFPLITLPIPLCNKQDLISRPYSIIIIILSCMAVNVYAYLWVQSSMKWSAWWVYFYYYKT